MKSDFIIPPNKKAQRAWAQLCEGKESGMFELYDMYGAKLLVFGQKRGNLDLAKDALQETFAALWKGRFRLGKTDSPKNYLFATYRRKLVSVLNDHRKYADANDYDFDLPDNQSLDATKMLKIKPVLEKLSANQKEIIYLKFYQGMDYDEIAEILDMNYQSARNLMSRAIKSIRSKINFLIF